MKVSRGDVVLIDHPFSDASGSKVRPVLIVQNDRRNSLLTETIVAIITKNIRHVGSDDTQLLIDVSTPDGQVTGLLMNSAVKCGKLFTIHESFIFKRLGSLPPRQMQHVALCLKAALELS